MSAVRKTVTLSHSFTGKLSTMAQAKMVNMTALWDSGTGIQPRVEKSVTKGMMAVKAQTKKKIEPSQLFDLFQGNLW